MYSSGGCKQSIKWLIGLPRHWNENIQIYPGFIGLTLSQAIVCCQQRAIAWTNDNKILFSRKWQLEHIYIPKLNKTNKGVQNLTILLNLSWNDLFSCADSSVKHLTADRTTGSTFVGVYVWCKQCEFNSNLCQTVSMYISTHRLWVFHVLWPNEHI